MNRSLSVVVFLIAIATLTCEGQRSPALPLSKNSFRQILRTKHAVPPGRVPRLSDIIIRHYSKNSTTPKSYRIRSISRILDDPDFDLRKPTVLYGHGYVELITDKNMVKIVKAYLQRDEQNLLILDWSNMAFGSYIAVVLGLKAIAAEVSKGVHALLLRGLSLEGLHLVGHSLGAHLMAYTARNLAAKGFQVPRLTGLDPAYPGFYPALLSDPMSSSDAGFVDAVHTDGGGFGAPDRTAHADFWPNEGRAKQPGCLSATVPLTTEDFCSHWRSVSFWAESVRGGEFLARRCYDYDAFLRGRCTDEPVVYMGARATHDLRGNFYLRTAASEPFALGERGAA
ncbi:pancreatic lipase-related protein 2-like [Pectinophora gossypiella]|uniref:pancreatic lipase-related protein 2-like n=1 Tax=Pectinophora gossypiella TaxID=13191 RepID=UPI00214E28B5|nr:pancreatic lipase-related protein 2-like [Pectinophora gossypiella]